MCEKEMETFWGNLWKSKTDYILKYTGIISNVNFNFTL